MFPLVDTHVHLLAGLDDGPQTMQESVAMAKVLVAEGVRHATALAHQNPDYPANDAAHLQAAAKLFAEALAAENIPLHIYPTGEVMFMHETGADFAAGRLQTFGGHGKLLLVEMPHGMFIDMVPLATELRAKGVRIVIAHAERYPELLHDWGTLEKFLAAGLLIQVTANEMAYPGSAEDERAMKNWAKRGVIHMLGSDGHNLTRREPRMRAGVTTLSRWIGPLNAERIASLWGLAALQGSNINPPRPQPVKQSWFTKLFGG
jgi:protein-tyrosine phosphatase